MDEQNPEDATRGARVDEVHRAIDPLLLAGSAFALGLVAGLFLKGAARQMYGVARSRQWHRDYRQTVTYDENLPESLGRREPPPEPGQPRYGGTGALGVSPAATARSGDSTRGARDGGNE